MGFSFYSDQDYPNHYEVSFFPFQKQPNKTYPHTGYFKYNADTDADTIVKVLLYRQAET